MTPANTVISGIELEQLLDRLDGVLQDHGAPALLEQLQAEVLQADSIGSIERLHVLWVNAGDAQAAARVLVDDGQHLLELCNPAARAELSMSLLLKRLRLAHFCDDEPLIEQVLGEIDAMAKVAPDYDVEYYRRSRIFEQLEQRSLVLALRAIEVRHALTLFNPGRASVRAWDLADRACRRAWALHVNGEQEQAREAALEGVAALRQAGPDQDIDQGDWIWLGNGLIEIIPLRLAMFEQPVVSLIADLSLPRRREWEVRLARLAARALHAQGDLQGALRILPAAAIALDSDCDNNFIEYELPWLVAAGEIEQAGRRALHDIYDMRAATAPITVKVVVEQLLAQEPSVWWPLCIMRACDADDVLEHFLECLPALDESPAGKGALIEALYEDTEQPERLEHLFALALAEAQRIAPRHPWILRLLAVRDRQAGRIDAATELAMLQEAIGSGLMNDHRSSYSLVHAWADTHGLLDALRQPPMVLASGYDYYNHSGKLSGLVEQHSESLTPEQQNEAGYLLEVAQRQAYELGQARLERYFASGQGHRGDGCAHLYSMLCNNLAINYRYLQGQERVPESIELHHRGIEASPFAEHYDGVLRAYIKLDDPAAICQAAEDLWNFAAAHGYGRHNPDGYFGNVSQALYVLDRDHELVIWLQRLLDWQAGQDISDQDVDYEGLRCRLRICFHLAHSQPEAALALWQRYESIITERQDALLTWDSADIFKNMGRKDEAIARYNAALALCAGSDEAHDIANAAALRSILDELQQVQAPVAKRWWQVWK
ncbi:hypothetical protein [Pseudomonas carassii]|uniref:Tetratricopeptide repeat-containing protein n=1 Tax=Pseudomonas carassii TaxID=3115855 RepID=A0ABU7HEV1_9PSED|nr:hypothetical protein [Pseudomonas sp. 137P]MEE1889834.1 hypothetical protein [Pseudomonas sp. 137P]